MKHIVRLFVLLATCTWTAAFGQIEFEPGYFIDNEGIRKNCLIKNVDWKNNPDQFRYKLIEQGTVSTGDLGGVQEFGIDKKSRYVRAMVNIDQSSDVVNRLSNSRNPQFVHDTVFLHVLVQGEATLYRYDESALTRFFYKVGDEPIEQLIYKRYKKSNNLIAINNQFRQQLINDMNCINPGTMKIERAKCVQKDLVDLFSSYNACKDNDAGSFISHEKQDLINLSLRPRYILSGFTFTDSPTGILTTDYGQIGAVSVGVEFEYIFPTNKRKWSFVIEPSYTEMKKELERPTDRIVGDKVLTKLDYSAIQLPVGFRHYFFLNKESQLMLNTGLVVDFELGSTVDFRRADNSLLREFELKPGLGFWIGGGYKWNDKITLEARYILNRTLSSTFPLFPTDYDSLMFIVGYSFL